MARKTAPKKMSLKRTVKDQSGAGKLKIGELLQKAGYITASQFNAAKDINKKTRTYIKNRKTSNFILFILKFRYFLI